MVPIVKAHLTHSASRPLGSVSTLHPRRDKPGWGGTLTWAGPGSAVWLGQDTAKVPSAALRSLQGRLPAGLSVDWGRPPGEDAEGSGAGGGVGQGRETREDAMSAQH